MKLLAVFLSCIFFIAPSAFAYPTMAADCAGVAGGTKVVDQCGICGGDGTSCLGCDGQPFGKALDCCGVCGGDGTSCLGCDGVAHSGKTVDQCGVCAGDGTSCLGCDGVPNSGKKVDACGICGGDGKGCLGCDGVPNSGKAVDKCGVCGGDDSTCKGCDGVPNSGKVVDVCNICGGDGKSCLGCDGVINSGKTVDECGVCGGDGTSCKGVDPKSCKNTEITDTIFILDGGSAALNHLAKNTGKKILKVASSNKKKAAIVASYIAQAEKLHMSAWTKAWSFPKVIGDCPIGPNCTVTDLTATSAQYTTDMGKLRRIVRSLSKLYSSSVKKSDAKKVEKSINANVERHYKEALDLVKKVPAQSISCSDLSKKS